MYRILTAVALALYLLAGSPDPEEVLGHALDRAFPFFLVDTWDKLEGDLSAFIDWDRPAVFSQRARLGGVRFVAAGKLGLGEFQSAAAVDVIAVRGAATAGERTARVERSAVEELSRLIHGELTAG